MPHEYHETDATTLILRLNELKSQFDQKMVQGDSFEEVKKIYKEIKVLKSQLQVINWQFGKVKY